ncbi:MAG TPA: hypothetical protein VK669_10825 [Candidatus Limnocylindrales bacterium]|nr:hypothetical protein [Candidatus Limnocylindrales bacterium]
MALEPAEVCAEMRRGIRVVVEIRALVVVELHRNHPVGDRPELRERMAEPARGVVPVRAVAHPLGRGRVGVRVLQRRGRGIPAFEHVVQRHAVFRAPQQPIGVSAVPPLVADHRPRPHDEAKAELLAEPQHFAQVAPRAGSAAEIELTVGELVPVPRHVQIERVRAERAHRDHRVAPLRARHPFVEERAAEEEEGFAVDGHHRVAGGVARDRRVPERRERRCRGGAAQREHRRERRRGERPDPADPRSHQEHDRADRERREAERDRERAGRPEQEQPAGERDERWKRVERDAERRAGRRVAREHECDDLTRALHQHDPGGERVDHEIEREQRGREREQPDRHQRDGRKPAARVQLRERREEVALERGRVWDA